MKKKKMCLEDWVNEMKNYVYAGGGEAEDGEELTLPAQVNEIIFSEHSDSVDFVTDLGTLTLYHADECCESVVIDQIDKEDIKGVVGDGPPRFVFRVKNGSGEHDFVELRYTFVDVYTRSGVRTFSFKGESNGYYSTSVNVSWVRDQAK